MKNGDECLQEIKAQFISYIQLHKIKKVVCMMDKTMIFSCMLWPVETEHDLSFVSVRQNFKTSLILKILRHLHTEVNIFFLFFSQWYYRCTSHLLQNPF